MEDLIRRLESATAGNIGLDSEIHFLIKNGEGCGAYGTAPKYSTSLDAALSLVKCPEGRGPCWTWRLDARIDSREMIVFAYVAEITVPSSEWRGYGRTPALALCAAALRARAAMQAEGK